MMVEWLNKIFKKKRRVTPKDDLHYYIDEQVLAFTDHILKDYGNKLPSSEGIVYWAGVLDGNNFYITCAIAPRAKTTRYGILTTHESNAAFVEFICDHRLLYVAQVHSHPSEEVDHSKVDDEETAFRAEGLVSIVVPNYSIKGLLPLLSCGIHRYINGKFSRLTNKYIKGHFKLFNSQESIMLKDLRNGH
jgi:hypothetical protein